MHPKRGAEDWIGARKSLRMKARQFPGILALALHMELTLQTCSAYLIAAQQAASQGSPYFVRYDPHHTWPTLVLELLAL